MRPKLQIVLSAGTFCHEIEKFSANSLPRIVS